MKKVSKMREKNKADLVVVSPDNYRQSFLNAMDIIPDSFVVWDKEFRFVDCNEPHRRLNADIAHLLVPGTKYEDYIRSRINFGTHSYIVGREEDWVADRIASMKSGKSDYEFSVGDKWYRIIRKRLDNGDYVNYQKDITDEKKREFELEESEKLYRALFEFSPDSVYIHDGEKILLANPAFVNLLSAQSVEEVLGRSIAEHIPLEIREKVMERIRGIWKSRTTAGLNEQEYIQMDGTRIEIEAQGTLIQFAGKDAILVIARDITRRKKHEKQLNAAYDNLETVVVERTKNLTIEIEERRSTEKALKDSEARFRDIAESASEWIWEMDENFRYTYMSDRAYETYGWDAEYPIGKTRFDLRDEGSWSIDRRAMDEHQVLFERHEEFKDVEVTVFTKDGQKFDTLISGKPIFNATGGFAGYRGMARDVSERMEIETELRKKEKISRVFLDATTDKVILLDAEGVVLDANDAMVARLKLSKENIIGENIFNILRGFK
jgi:PAS domain S-box-containing protein